MFLPDDSLLFTNLNNWDYNTTKWQLWALGRFYTYFDWTFTFYILFFNALYELSEYQPIQDLSGNGPAATPLLSFGLNAQGFNGIVYLPYTKYSFYNKMKAFFFLFFSFFFFFFLPPRIRQKTINKPVIHKLYWMMALIHSFWGYFSWKKKMLLCLF